MCQLDIHIRKSKFVSRAPTFNHYKMLWCSVLLCFHDDDSDDYNITIIFLQPLPLSGCFPIISPTTLWSRQGRHYLSSHGWWSRAWKGWVTNPRTLKLHLFDSKPWALSVSWGAQFPFLWAIREILLFVPTALTCRYKKTTRNYVKM